MPQNNDLNKIHKLSNKHLLKRSASYFLPYKFRVIVAFISLFAVSGATAATAWLVKPAMDDIFMEKNADMLILIPIAYVAITLVKGVFRFLQTYLMNATSMRVVENLRNEMYERIICLPVRYFEASQLGMLMSRILGDVGGISNSVPSIIMLIRETVTIIGLVFVVFYQDSYLAFWSVLVLPLAIYPFIYFGKKLRKIGRQGQVQQATINTVVQESLSGVRVVKAFGTEQQEAKRFQDESSDIVSIALRRVFASEISSRIMEVIGAVGVGTVLFYGGMQVIEGESTPGTFFSFMAALIMLYEPIKKISAANMNIQSALASAERVFGLLDSPEIRAEHGGNVMYETPFKELNISNLTFQYPTGEKPAIDNLNLSVKAGQRVAIVGPSGSGKTTLVNLLPRFYDAQQGSITINGHSLEEYDLKSLRLNLGMVSQDAFLFNLSIRDNIAYGEKEFSQEEIENAAKAAYAHDFITELPNGYNTVVGERGVMLSGGQKQRITIARALLKNPSLLILDEATSALDTQAERIVQQALDNLMKDRTSIVIAHRLSTILSADNIVVMRNAKIVGEGNHRNLLKSCELYKKLYEMQFDENATLPD